MINYQLEATNVSSYFCTILYFLGVLEVNNLEFPVDVFLFDSCYYDHLHICKINRKNK